MTPLVRADFVGPWAGLPVAWRDDDTFDEQTYRHDIASCCRAGVPGIYTGGTTGEFYAMEFDEFAAVSRATVDECHRHGKPAMIGCTSTYTRGVARRAAFAAEIGADAIQVALPFWMEMADDLVVPFFKEVASAADGLPLSIYETTRAKKTLSLAQHEAIKKAVPAYLMVKANAKTVGVTREGCAALSEFVNVFVGEWLWSELGPFGAIGSCSARIYWNPRVDMALWECLRDKRWKDLERALAPMLALGDYIHHVFGPAGYTDTAYDRLGGRATGFLRTSLRSRKPYPPVTEEGVALFRQWCERHYPEMLVL